MPSVESNYQHSGLLDNIGWLDNDELDLKLVIVEPRRAKIDDDYHKTRKELKELCQPRCKLPRNAKSIRALSAKRLEPVTTRTFLQSFQGSDIPPSPNVLGLKSSGSPTQAETSTLLPSLPSVKSRRIPRVVCSSMPLADSIKDSDGVHYQDLEDQLKLRVYLASSQNHDKTVERGFPSRESVANTLLVGEQTHRHEFELVDQSFEKWLDNDHLRSFFLEDRETSDGGGTKSTADPTSHMTSPSPVPVTFLPACKTVLSAAECATPSCGSNVQSSSLPREMTLRMTLTRSDLRASEEEMYGWQSTGSGADNGIGWPATPLKPEPASISAGTGHENPRRLRKESMERLFASFDQERHPQQDAESVDRGFKRIWGRVWLH